jgi:hypothetical protein
MLGTWRLGHTIAAGVGSDTDAPAGSAGRAGMSRSRIGSGLPSGRFTDTAISCSSRRRKPTGTTTRNSPCSSSVIASPTSGGKRTPRLAVQRRPHRSDQHGGGSARSTKWRLWDVMERNPALLISHRRVIAKDTTVGKQMRESLSGKHHRTGLARVHGSDVSTCRLLVCGGSQKLSMTVFVSLLRCPLDRARRPPEAVFPVVPRVLQWVGSFGGVCTAGAGPGLQNLWRV